MHGFSALNSEAIKANQSFITQSALSFSIDDFVEIYNLSSPNYLKVDVDGVEDRILSGASKTLQSEHLRSVLIETAGRNDYESKKLQNFFKDFGCRNGADRKATEWPTKPHFLSKSVSGRPGRPKSAQDISRLPPRSN